MADEHKLDVFGLPGTGWPQLRLLQHRPRPGRKRRTGKTSAEATTRVTSASSCGPPSLSGAASVVSYINTTLSLNLQFTNIGTSDALNALVKTLTFRTLGGTGSVTLASPSCRLSSAPSAWTIPSQFR